MTELHLVHNEYQSDVNVLTIPAGMLNYTILSDMHFVTLKNEEDIQMNKDVVNENTNSNYNDNVYEIEKGYITGFFDAEGMVRLEPGGLSLIGITQWHRPVLDYIKSKFNAGSIGIHSKEHYDNKGIHHKGASRWRISSYELIPFLEYVQQYSIEKKDQINLMLEYLTKVKPYFVRRMKLSESQTLKRQWYVNELQRLKKEKNPVSIPDMSENIKLGYFTGFFDGEGYVGIEKGTKDSYTLKIQLNNTNINILQLYKDTFGGEIRHLHGIYYQWYPNKNENLEFLKTIYEYSKVKHNEIKYAIEFEEWHNHIGIISTYEQKEIALWYYNKLIELKELIEDPTEYRPFNYEEIMKGNTFRNKTVETQIIKKYLESIFTILRTYEVDRNYWFEVVDKNNNPVKICHIGRNLDYSKKYNYSRWGINIQNDKADYYILSLWDKDTDTTPIKVLLIHRDEIIKGMPIRDTKYLNISNSSTYLKPFEQFNIMPNKENTTIEENNKVHKSSMHTLDEAKNIREDYAKGDVSCHELAEIYDTTPTTICNIINNKVLVDNDYIPPKISIDGENNSQVKLTKDTVNEIREKYRSNTKLKYSDLAKEYNVTESAISAIIRNERWIDENYIPVHRTGLEGENSPNAKLTKNIVNEIRTKYINDKNLKQPDLAKEYNLNIATIGRILRNESWVDPEYKPVLNRKGKGGENNNSSKLTWDIVNNIRDKFGKGASRKELSKEFGISMSQIGAIVTNESWKDVNYQCVGRQNPREKLLQRMKDGLSEETSLRISDQEIIKELKKQKTKEHLI